MQNNMTYAQLDEALNLWLITNNSSGQELKNFRSVLNRWRAAFEIWTHHVVGKEFNEDFEQFCSKFAKQQKKENYKFTTWSSRLSRIRKIRKFYLEHRRNPPIPSTFHERLIYFINLRGYSTASFTKAFDDLSPALFTEWLSGEGVPRKKHRSIIIKFERFLKIAPDTLSSKIDWISCGTASVRSTATTNYGKRVRINSKKRFYVWTDRLEEEFAGWEYFQTTIVPPAGMQRSKRSLWTSAKGAPRATAQRVKANLKAFFGFCALSPDAPDPMLRGSGIHKDKLTLSLLADSTLTEKFLLEFKFSRTAEKFNNGYLTFITSVAAVLRPATGYLYQQSEFAARLGISMSEWQGRCAATRQRLLEIKSAIEAARTSGSGEFEMGRNPQEPIAVLLASPRPLAATMMMVDRMIHEVNKPEMKFKTKAYLFRDILLLSLLQANPLRLRMFRIMNFDENLARGANGSWWIKFKKEDFKNRRMLSGDYEVQLPEEIWEIIERYKNEFRPYFFQDTNSKLVFLSGGKEAMCASNVLYNAVYTRTRQYISGCPGFGPQAFRHLVATAIIKDFPATGFFLAAKVLHDKIETVEQNYAHLKTNDFIEPYNRLFTKLWSASCAAEPEKKDPDDTDSNPVDEEESK